MTVGWALRRTQRLVLRAVTVEDTDALADITTDPRTNLHRPGGAPDAAEHAASVVAFAQSWVTDSIGYWVVEHDGVVIGIWGVKPFSFRGRHSWNVYYRFGADSWGHGFALESVREALMVAAEIAPEKPVLARTSADNAGSIRVAERAGLVRRPDLDEGGYVVLAADWH